MKGSTWFSLQEAGICHPKMQLPDRGPVPPLLSPMDGHRHTRTCSWWGPSSLRFLPLFLGGVLFTSLFPFCPSLRSPAGKACLRERCWRGGDCHLATVSLRKARKGFHLRGSRDTSLPFLVAIKVLALTPVSRPLAGPFADLWPCCLFLIQNPQWPAHQKVTATSKHLLGAPFLAFSLPLQSLQSPIVTTKGLANPRAHGELS